MGTVRRALALALVLLSGTFIDESAQAGGEPSEPSCGGQFDAVASRVIGTLDRLDVQPTTLPVLRRDPCNPQFTTLTLRQVRTGSTIVREFVYGTGSVRYLYLTGIEPDPLQSDADPDGSVVAIGVFRQATVCADQSFSVMRLLGNDVVSDVAEGEANPNVFVDVDPHLEVVQVECESP